MVLRCVRERVLVGKAMAAGLLWERVMEVKALVQLRGRENARVEMLQRRRDAMRAQGKSPVS
jgi:hypothetical protein